MADMPPHSTKTAAHSDADKITTSKHATAKAKRAANKEAAKAERIAQKAKAKEEKQKVKSLAKMAEAKILNDLGASLKSHAQSATFACGGSVVFHAGTDDTARDAGYVPAQDASSVASSVTASIVTDVLKDGDAEPIPATIKNVQIRFGPSGNGFTVIFDNNGPSSDFKHLVKACDPASFGRGGEAILDEKYRKAGKLDCPQFATSFCPYQTGIIDVITQLLVPQHKHEKHTRSIRAELYKLNVYSAPGGKFKPHVDTPRNKDQIGSLVVSLPSAHQGGQLSVNNAGAGAGGLNVVFDWSSDGTEPGEIKWAAFYSDCEHEVHEVTSGHRVTLTYNLCLTRGLGHLAGDSSVLDPTQLPLYEGLFDALENPGFLRRGRVLALYLNHCYAHTSAHVNFLPESLKGADMSLWNTAKALGLMCQVVPVMALDYSYDDSSHIYEPKFRTFNGGGSGGYMLEESGRSWGHHFPVAKVTWLNASGDEAAKGSKKKAQAGPGATRPSLKEVQLAYMTYGNEPGIGIDYSRAVMLIRMPPYHERFSGKAEPKSIWDGIKLDPSEYEDWSDYEGEYIYSSDENSWDEDSDMEMGEDDEDDGADDDEGDDEDGDEKKDEEDVLV